MENNNNIESIEELYQIPKKDVLAYVECNKMRAEKNKQDIIKLRGKNELNEFILNKTKKEKEQIERDIEELKHELEKSNKKLSIFVEKTNNKDINLTEMTEELNKMSVITDNDVNQEVIRLAREAGIDISEMNMKIFEETVNAGYDVKNIKRLDNNSLEVHASRTPGRVSKSRKSR